MMTIKEHLNTLSNLNLSKSPKQEKVFQNNIINHTTLAYKLDISEFNISLLNKYGKHKIALINTDVLSYTQDLQLIKKN